MTTITDSFTRAGADALGTSAEGWSWAELTGDLDVSSSGVTAESTGYSGQNFARANSDLASANHYAQVKVTQWAADSQTAVQVHARFSSAANSSVCFYVRNDSGGSAFTYRIFKQTSASFTQIGSTISTTAPTAPYTARIEVDSSNMLKGFIDGVQKISVGPDSFNSTAVRTGIGAVPISPTPTLLDDFEAGDLSSGTTYNDTVTETATASDSIAGTASVAASVSETGAAGDSAAASAIVNASVSESGTATDAMSDGGGTVYSDSLTESVTATDVLSASAITVASVAESASATDLLGVSGSQTFGDALTEGGNAQDSYGISGSSDAEESVGSYAAAIETDDEEVIAILAAVVPLIVSRGSHAII